MVIGLHRRAFLCIMSLGRWIKSCSQDLPSIGYLTFCSFLLVGKFADLPWLFIKLLSDHFRRVVLFLEEISRGSDVTFPMAVNRFWLIFRFVRSAIDFLHFLCILLRKSKSRHLKNTLFSLMTLNSIFVNQ